MHRSSRWFPALLLAAAIVAVGCGSSSPSEVPVGSSSTLGGAPTSTVGGVTPTTSSSSQGNSGTTYVPGAGTAAP